MYDMYGMDKVLEPAVDDIKKLEQVTTIHFMPSMCIHLCTLSNYTYICIPQGKIVSCGQPEMLFVVVHVQASAQHTIV